MTSSWTLMSSLSGFANVDLSVTDDGTDEEDGMGSNISSFAVDAAGNLYVTDSNDVSSVTQKAADFSDVVYLPTDNTAASNTEAIANVLIPAGVPAICGEEGICRGCGVATLSISYYDLGVTIFQRCQF